MSKTKFKECRKILKETKAALEVVHFILDRQIDDPGEGSSGLRSHMNSIWLLEDDLAHAYLTLIKVFNKTQYEGQETLTLKHPGTIYK